jgi:hypothetical protein
MHWVYVILSLFSCCRLSANERAPTFRETIERYGYTDKDTVHYYVDSYEQLLRPFTNRRCNLLEIGIESGGSAIMWYEHLPKSTLYLLDCQDITKAQITSAMDPSRWSLTLRDAYTPGAVATMQQKCPGGFDIIIDDGPHTLESQQFVVVNYLPLLNHGGVLVIEDIAEFQYVEILEHCVPASSEYGIEVIDLRSVKNRFDDVLFVVRRR